MGYYRAGFDVIGVDIVDQPNYPFRFVQADALEYLANLKRAPFAAIHASPPCQSFSTLNNLDTHNAISTIDHIGATRMALQSLNIPYVIENVRASPLLGPTRLCGLTFGLQVERHRLFEPHGFAIPPRPCKGLRTFKTVGVYGDHPQISRGMNRARTLDEGQRAMGIDWMTWAELTQAIPPAFTEYVGQFMIEAVR